MIGRAKRMAVKNVKGDHVQQHVKFWDYLNEDNKAIPDFTLEIVLDDQQLSLEGRIFKRIYACLGPAKKGFKTGCRPIIGLDGCHLKGP